MAGSVMVHLAVIAMVAISPDPSSRRGSIPVQPVHQLDRQKVPHVDAAEYQLKDALRYNIFAVPERNAVGTNSLNNAITLLDLAGGKVKYREVRRNFKKYVSGGEMVFLPEFSRDTIGYSQTRGFLLFNVKTGEFTHRIVVRLMEETIKDVAVLDWEKRLFLFNVQLLSGGEPITELHVLDLSAEEPDDIGSFELKTEPRFAVLGKTTFYFTGEGKVLRLHALDQRLKPTDHPLLTVYNTGLIPGEPELPTLHPTLPIALFAAELAAPAGGLAVWAAEWGDRAAKPRIFKLLESNSGDFSFSPDGKWVLFLDSTEDPTALFVMPVDPGLPQLFGPPIRLETKHRIPDDLNGNCAWISDPVSVVCAVERSEQIAGTDDWKDTKMLLKWELSPARVRK